MKNELNILHISPYFNYVCGVSKHVYLVLKELKSLEEKSNINLFFITNGGDSIERLNKIGINPYIIKFSNGLRNIFNIQKNLKQLEKFCVDNKIDIIHTHHRYPEFLSYLIKKKLNIKTITTVHSIVDGYKYLCFNSDKIIAVSKSVKNHIIKNYSINENKILQLYNFIDDQKTNNKKNNIEISLLNIQKDSKIFLFVGRWSKDKGIDILINTFNELEKENHKIYLIIISNISEKIKEKLLSRMKNIIFIPSQNDISKYYELCDAVILPSRVDPFPYVMLEAGYSKKMFIGSNVDGIAEFIENEKNGFLFESGNTNNLLNTIKKVISLSDSEKKIITENFYQKTLHLTNKANYINSLLKIYYELV